MKKKCFLLLTILTLTVALLLSGCGMGRITEEEALTIAQNLLSKANKANMLTGAAFISTYQQNDTNYTKIAGEKQGVWLPGGTELLQTITCTEDIRELLSTTFSKDFSEKIQSNLFAYEGYPPLYKDIDGALHISSEAPNFLLLMGTWDMDTLQIQDIGKNTFTAMATLTLSNHPNAPKLEELHFVREKGIWLLTKSYASSYITEEYTLPAEKVAHIVTEAVKNGKIADVLHCAADLHIVEGTEEGTWYSLLSPVQGTPFKEAIVKRFTTIQAIEDFFEKNFTSGAANDFLQLIRGESDRGMSATYMEKNGKLYVTNEYGGVPLMAGEWQTEPMQIVEATETRIVVIMGTIWNQEPPEYRPLYLENVEGIWKMTKSYAGSQRSPDYWAS